MKPPEDLWSSHQVPAPFNCWVCTLIFFPDAKTQLLEKLSNICELSVYSPYLSFVMFSRALKRN